MPEAAKGRPCTVCNHPLREKIDRFLVTKEMPLERQADKFDLGVDALRRHRDNPKHLPEDKRRQILLDAKRERDQEVADELNGEQVEIKSGLKRILTEIDSILKRAKDRGDDPLALVSLREMRQTLLDLAKVYGTLKNELTINVNLADMPQWQQLREILVDVFRDHPEAELAFIEQTRHLRLGPPDV